MRWELMAQVGKPVSMQCKEGICAKAHNGSKEEKAEVK